MSEKSTTYDLYSLIQIIENGLPNRLELIEKAILSFGSDFEPLTVYENHVFVVNKKSGDIWKLAYQLKEGGVIRFENPVLLSIDSEIDRISEEQRNLSRKIVESLAESDFETLDSYRARYFENERRRIQLENKLNIKVGAKSKGIVELKRIVTEAVNSTKNALSVLKRCRNNDNFCQLLDEGYLYINPNEFDVTYETDSREKLVYQNIIEGRRSAMSLIESPVFTEYLKNLYEELDEDEAIEFIAENYQEIFTLSIKEQTELFYNILEKQGIDPDLPKVVDCVLNIGKYAVSKDDIREQLERLTKVIKAEGGNFHERMQIIEREIGVKKFKTSDVSALLNVVNKIIDSVNENVKRDFVVDIQRAEQKLREIKESGFINEDAVNKIGQFLSIYYSDKNLLREEKDVKLIKPKKGEKYQDYFKRVLKQEFGAESPKELSTNEKDRFFTMIEKGWTKEKRDDSDATDVIPPKKGEKYKDYFKRILKQEFGAESPKELSTDEKDRFFTMIERGWTKEKRDDGDAVDESVVCKNCGSPVCLCQGLNS